MESIKIFKATGGYYEKNIDYRYSKDMTETYIGRFALLLSNLNHNNLIYGQVEDLLKILRISKKRALIETLKVFKKFKLIKTMKENNIIYVYINPTIIQDGELTWTKELFDLFDDELREYLSNNKYLLIKSKFYECNHEILTEEWEDLDDGVSGIYRLYKNNIIVYIGKSVDIRSRLYNHKREKDIDSFDFTILDNESDKNIYELYLIDAYKPILNRDCNEKSKTTIELEEPTFSKIIKL